MPHRHAVVSGASVAGLSSAFWLPRTGWDVTVVERADAFRDGGQNVDVRGVAHEVLDRMGLTETVRRHHTTEVGTVVVDECGRRVAELPSDGQDGATAELEILRGDLARSVLEVLPDDVTVVHGEVVEDDPAASATTGSRGRQDACSTASPPLTTCTSTSSRRSACPAGTGVVSSWWATRRGA